MNVVKGIYNKLPDSIKIIAKKIRQRLKDNLLNKSPKSVTQNQFCENLLKYDIISFDIFDTLITRTIFEPDDIFKLMEEKLNDIVLKNSFFSMRKKAEEVARKKYNKDVNLDDIYVQFGEIYDYDQEIVNKIKELEISLELGLAVPRKTMLSVLEELNKHNKEIILISDMYLNASIIKKMLEKCGYLENKHYSLLYLSNEINKRKDNGRMWKYIKHQYKGKKLIHVGDNIHSDFNEPMKNRIRAVHIDSSRDLFKKTEYYLRLNKYVESRNISTSFFLGYMINEVIFNSPFSIIIDSLDKFSKVFLAPVLLNLLEFIDKNTKNNEMLLFLAREGYNLQKLYKDYVKIFEVEERINKYFLSSRIATMNSTIENVDDLKEFLNGYYCGTIKHFLKIRFDIDYDNEDYAIKLPGDYKKVLEIVNTYSKDIIEKSKEYKKSYLTYVSSVCDKKKNIVICDLGYSGTIQYHLSKMLKKDFKGLYLTNSENVKKYSTTSNLLFDFDIRENEKYKKILTYSLILEYFLSAPDGQLRGFKFEGEKVIPIYDDDVMSETTMQNINVILNSIRDYMNRISELKKIYDLDFDKELLCENYVSIIESNIIDSSVKDYFVYKDTFTEIRTVNIFEYLSI